MAATYMYTSIQFNDGKIACAVALLLPYRVCAQGTM